jgi:aminoglycoside phosphotransferase
MKFGRKVRPVEAHNMLYVARYTTIPVPKVYGMYQRNVKEKTITYILMKYIPGKSLVDLRDELDQTRKTSIARTLRSYFDQLRQL